MCHCVCVRMCVVTRNACNIRAIHNLSACINPPNSAWEFYNRQYTTCPVIKINTVCHMHLPIAIEMSMPSSKHPHGKDFKPYIWHFLDNLAFLVCNSCRLLWRMNLQRDGMLQSISTCLQWYKPTKSPKPQANPGWTQKISDAPFTLYASIGSALLAIAASTRCRFPSLTARSNLETTALFLWQMEVLGYISCPGRKKNRQVRNLF